MMNGTFPPFQVRIKGQTFLQLLTTRFPHLQWSISCLGTLLDIIEQVSATIEAEESTQQSLTALEVTPSLSLSFSLSLLSLSFCVSYPFSSLCSLSARVCVFVCLSVVYAFVCCRLPRSRTGVVLNSAPSPFALAWCWICPPSSPLGRKFSAMSRRSHRRSLRLFCLGLRAERYAIAPHCL